MRSCAPLSLTKLRWLAHGFSTRDGGVSKCYGGGALNLGFTAHDTKAAVEVNRRKFISALAGDATRKGPGKKINQLVTVCQIHSDLIHHISQKFQANRWRAMEWSLSVPGLLLGILTADCLPAIFLVDPKETRLGVLTQAGAERQSASSKKVSAKCIAGSAVTRAILKAAIGPGIRDCCYEVGPEIQSTFDAQFSYGRDLFPRNQRGSEIHEKYPLLFLTSRAPGHSELPKKIFLDLAEANRRQLIRSREFHLKTFQSSLLTGSHCKQDLFFSHRGEKGVTERMMAAVGITT